MADRDLVVIGAGAAGLSVANVAARLGLRVTLIERGTMGGECLNTGCVPSKALLAAAHAAMSARDAARYGIRLPPPEIDWPAVLAHVQNAIATIAPTDSAARYESLGAEILHAEARLTAPGTIAVAGREITARRIVLALGSRPAIPDIPGLSTLPYLTNETLFTLPERPGHLLILGAGPMGVEMAQAFAELGAPVTLVARGRILPTEDAELAAFLADTLRAAGVTIHEHLDVTAAEPGPTLLTSTGGRLAGTHLLLATGRRPTLDGLDAARIATTPRGIATDRSLRSPTNRRVWAIGDCADPQGLGPRRLTHVATQHAAIVIRNALFHLPARLDYTTLPRVIYTDPELAQIGATAVPGGQTLRWSLAENDRAIAEGRPVGLVKLHLDHAGRLRGASILAPDAGEMAPMIALLIGRRHGLRALADLVVPYPTRAEALKRAAGTFYAPKLFAAGPRRLARLLARLT